MRGSSGRIALPLLSAGSMAALGIVIGRFPLFSVPGYELAELGTLFAAVLGAPLGIAAARRTIAGFEVSVGWAFLSAAWKLTLLLVVFFVAAAVRGAIGSRCSIVAGSAFLPVLTLPCALLAVALGVLAGVASGGRRVAAALLYLAAGLVSLALTLRTAYKGPAAYLIDHLLGYWPGPIYDEVVDIDERLLLFQAGTLAWTLAAISASALLPIVYLRINAPFRPQRRLAPVAALVVAVATAATIHGVMVARGDLATQAHLAQVLGTSQQGRFCTIVFPIEKSPEEAERLVRDCELDAVLVSRALAIENPPRVTVYFYRSQTEKRRLLGAGYTDFTKPWLAEVHLLDAPVPHPVLRHELIHALASSFARGPLRVPGRWGVLVSPGLIEGLAVAVDPPQGEWTAHEWTRAMRDLGLMPHLLDLFGPAGFFGAAPARAYTVAGSFLAFLLEHYGPEPVKRVYGDTTFKEAFGKPLEGLAAEWSSSLDRIAVPAELRTVAEARFRGESLFVRSCAREEAQLRARARESWQSGRAREAASLWKRAADLSGDLDPLRAAGDAMVRAGDLQAAEQTYSAALNQAGDRRALRIALESAQGDLLWRRGDPAGAEARYRSALALSPEPAEARLLTAKIAACGDPAIGRATAPWLLQLGDPAVALARLTQLDAPLSQYLLGRALLARGAPRFAARTLSRVRSRDLPAESFTLETRRLLAEAQCAAGQWDDAAAGFEALASDAPRLAQRLRAADANQRCRLERELFSRPVAMPGDLQE